MADYSDLFVEEQIYLHIILTIAEWVLFNFDYHH